MADWYKKLGDDGHPFRCQLAWEGGRDDLTGCSVSLRYHRRKTADDPTEIDGVVEDATAKIVSAEFDPTEAGTYKVEWAVTWPDTSVSTFPEDDYLIIEVLGSLVPPEEPAPSP